MFRNKPENNHVVVKGVLTGGLKYSHDYEREGFYYTYIKVERKSRFPDRIPIMLSERLMNNEWRKEGNLMEIQGEYRSHNHVVGGKLKLELAVYVREYRVVRRTDNEQINRIQLSGILCREPVYRITPKGKEITDLMVAVNREYRKTDYIPCICWGRNARKMREKKVGEFVRISGRIQSRLYVKREADGREYICTAYEVSVNNFE